MMKQSSAKIWWILALVVVVLVTGWSAVRAGETGFWEPWESVVVLSAVEGSQEAVEQETVERSWVMTRLVAMGAGEQPPVESGMIGEVERRSRGGLLAVWLIFLAVVALWMRRQAGDAAAALTLVAVATAPIFYLGATFLSGPLVYITASAVVVMAFFESARSQGRGRWLWALAAGGALAVVALDERLVGVYATLATLVALALVEAVDGGEEDEGGLGYVALSLTMLAAAALVYWGWSGAQELGERLWLVVPVILLVGLSLAARRNVTGRALVGPAGLILVAGAAVPLVGLLQLDGVEFAHLLQNLSVAEEVSAAGNFAWWWRQVGFGLFPHTIFIVPAMGYLAWRLRPQVKSSKRQRSTALLLLVWPVAAFVAVAPAVSLGHTVYPALFPFLAAIGWMIADSDFWRRLRREPTAYFSVALVAVFAVMILAKDLENFPTRLVEFILDGEEGLGLEDDYQYGEALSLWKYAAAALLVAYFSGMISWLVFFWRDVKRLKGWVQSRWRRFRKKEEAPQPVAEAEEGEAAISPGVRRLAQREAFREEEGVLSRIARVVERLPGRVALVTVLGVSFLAVVYLCFLPDLDGRLSTRAVMEKYLESSEEGEELWRYQVRDTGLSFYLRGIEELENRQEFDERYGEGDRFFALIPGDRLAATHSAVRRVHEENLAVLAKSGGVLLVSNRLEDGEEDFNEISEFLVEDLDEEEYIPLVVESGGREMHPSFSRQIEFVGYRLDRGSAEERAVYQWGDVIEITMYFRVLRRIPRAQEIFMHIDQPGSRIHGDHDPVGGHYPTNHWLRGDVIKDVHRIEVERFTSPGTYTIRTGFYRNDDRMEVRPEEAHDGENRVEVTQIEVAPF